jgi:hypothetical protein
MKSRTKNGRSWRTVTFANSIRSRDFQPREAAMWSIRSVGDRVVPAFCCLIFTLIAGGAQAQKATDASDSKRVQVLQIKEGTAAKEIAVRKPKSAATHAKKKGARRNDLSQVVTPAQNDISSPAAEQTGTLGVGDRVVAFASSPGDNNDVGLSVANQVGAIGEPASAPAVGNPPRANVDAEQSSTNQMLGPQVLTGGSPLSQALATLSGAMVAAAFGWFLVSSSRRRISVSTGT